MTAVDTFIPTGLLEDDEGNALTWRESQRTVFDDLLAGGKIQENNMFRSNGLLDEDEEPEETGKEDEGSLAPVSCSKGSQAFGRPSALLMDEDEPETAEFNSQDELPSLTQLLGASRKEKPTTTSNVPSVSELLASIGHSIAAVTFDGKTVNLRKRTKRKITTTCDRQPTSCLLEVPLHRLKDRLSEKTAAELSRSEAEAGPSKSTSTSSANDDLWVDKYRPSRFTDLLGDERVHRETMTWMKEWDYCVFGKRTAFHKLKRFDSGGPNQQDNKYEDIFKRPREKILLLSGAAGFGKTTLAHVVAKQAGYDVMEINASDARTGQVIDDRIRPTLEAGSKVGSAKPVCLVIDEIDGATGAGENQSTFVHKLIGLTLAKPKKKGKTAKENAVARPLMRPIICICNDLYASSLTQLRQHARIIRFNRPADVHLTKRLRFICEGEGLRAESRALSALVGVTKGDMRSCLNTLQLVRAKSLNVTESVIRSATVGMKEGDDSTSSVLNNLFAPLPRKRVKELGLTDIEESRYVGRLSSEIEASGTPDRIALGCFEHYARLRHFEASLSRHAKGVSWLATFDMLSGAMRSDREYGLLPYLPFSLVPFYPLFNERGGTKVERPKADWEAYTKMKENEEIFNSLAKCTQMPAAHKAASHRHILSNEIMQLELAPYINRIICPPMRPVNQQITKPHERALLNRIVEIMVSFGLAFVREKTEDGQLIFRLDPPVDALISYDGKRPSDIPIQRHGTRSLISQEVNAYYAARDQDIVEKGKKKTPGMFQKTVADELGIGLEGGLLGKRKAEPLDIADKPPVDFFGRPIAQTAKPVSKKSRNERSASGSHQSSKKEFKVSFKYNEGNSAAVRRPVKISSFL